MKIHPTHIDFTNDEVRKDDADYEVEGCILVPDVCIDSEIDSDSSCSSDEVKKSILQPKNPSI